jgi:20S proteasome alpha/beta subunit
MNRLEKNWRQMHKPFWPKLKPERINTKPPHVMTQIVGIVCKETVILASESQYTIDEYKVLEKPKLDSFTFKDGNQALVALAGAVKAAKRTIELLKETAKETNCETEPC